MTASATPSPAYGDAIPRGTVSGFMKYFKYDIVSGFLVFLIALPLCLGIALSYGFPAISGVFTAIIGGIVTTFISNSELTIKGPAAGLIVIVGGCTAAFGWNEIPGDINMDAYRSTLAVGVAAGVIQILLGMLRVGSLGEFFPSSVVHGMLAAIGVIILAKMFPQALGVKIGGEPLHLLLAIPRVIQNYHPTICKVGLVSIAIMFIWPMLKFRFTKAIPAALVVLAVTIPLARVLDLSSMHTNALKLQEKTSASAPAVAEVSTDSVAQPAPAAPKSDTLISVPAFGETFSFLTFPKFEALAQPVAWKWIAMFAIIGTLESMLSAKAMDLMDPWQRKTSLDRDNIAVGVANTLTSFVGSTPMISEIVRSRANMDNGARTRFGNMWHGVFLLAFVCLLPSVIMMIPVSALMGMLVFTGFRLAHPREFVHAYHIGPEQLLIYTATMVGCFAIDLLAGVAIGIALKLVIHVLNGAPVGSLFKACVSSSECAHGRVVLTISRSAVFSNWLGIRRHILVAAQNASEITLDFSDTRLVDHTVMSNLNQLKKQMESSGQKLIVCGLELHKPLSHDANAARKKRSTGMLTSEIRQA